jgi:hypothetical protein
LRLKQGSINSNEAGIITIGWGKMIKSGLAIAKKLKK